MSVLPLVSENCQNLKKNDKKQAGGEKNPDALLSFSCNVHVKVGTCVFRLLSHVNSIWDEKFSKANTQ